MIPSTSTALFIVVSRQKIRRGATCDLCNRCTVRAQVESKHGCTGPKFRTNIRESRREQ